MHHTFISYSHTHWIPRTAVATVLATVLSIASPALAADTQPTATTIAASNSTEEVQPIYFGNGCFWGRQYDFINAEKNTLNRSTQELSAIVGYAGGKQTSPSGKTCYYYNPDRSTVYEKLGHAEVVKVDLKPDGTLNQTEQFRELAKIYFKQFRRLPNGKYIRQDPQDMGAGYRNVVGLPGGVNGPLFKILQQENVNNMALLEGQGNEYTEDGKAVEDDKINTIWVVDSEKLPFYPAEKYHQFHNGLGKAFPTAYTKDLKQEMIDAGKVKETGCLEVSFF